MNIPQTLADLYRQQAQTRAQEPILLFEEQKMNGATLNARANQVAQALLAQSIAPGTRIAYLGKNMPSYFEILGGIAKSNAVLVGINWRLAPEEILYILNDAQCPLLFLGEEFAQTVEEIRAQCPHLKHIIMLNDAYETWRDAHPPDDPQLPCTQHDEVTQIYTSGTTGNPKGAVMTNGSYHKTITQAFTSPWGQTVAQETTLVCMPLFHISGLNLALLCMAQGRRIILTRDVDIEEILRLIPEHKIGMAFLVPVLVLFLLEHPRIGEVDFSCLHYISYGGAPMPRELLERARAQFVNCQFYQFYGLTEANGTVTCLAPEDHDNDSSLNSCGRPQEGIELRIADPQGNSLPHGHVGEILVQTPAATKGYWQNPEATAKTLKEGWLHTGDLGFLDEDGFLHLHDRLHDMIISGGENIYPTEVTNALMSHPGVVEAAVFGIPDDRWGEAVKAAVVRRGEVPVSEEELIAHVRSRLAAYKAPKSIDFIDMLPRNASGKVLLYKLRAPYWKEKQRHVN